MAALTRERRRIRVTGVVQGVGFRPFVHRLAVRHGLRGFVLNDGHGVVIEIEGEPRRLDGFALALVTEAPPLARIAQVTTERVDARGGDGFEIRESAAEAGPALVPPDVATCDACLRELFDPDDRRYRYPFVNCTQCGPRFTIVRRTPYDRANTTMAAFALCELCRSEYENPGDRRFHAEATCCPACGPQLSVTLDDAARVLAEGGIVAVKGLGGYHLACDATNAGAVARLRERKRRDEKPFALMTREPDEVAHVADDERALLGSPSRPIVLLRRRAASAVADAVAPGTPWLGVMLPYTPLHHLLCADAARPLVMTSGNVSDEPIAVDDADARHRLGAIADLFLTHDRAIHRRCEDSVARRRFPIRRSRGYVPRALPLPVRAAEPIVAAGAELKSTFCVARGGEAFLSPHLGDLVSDAAYRAFESDLALYREMLRIEPRVVACDLHPEYFSTRWAHAQQAEVVGVQHHHAHAAACLAENGAVGPALALVFDGGGWGLDGTLWGSELLRCDLTEFERLAHLEPVPQPGDAALREPWRMAARYLERAGLPVPWNDWDGTAEGTTLSAGMGRVFDAVAALLGVRERVTYEGQAAIELELLAGDTAAAPYDWRFGDGTALVARCYEDREAGRARDEIAAAFHETVAAAAADACAETGERGGVVLSGGTFQNLRLLASTKKRLEEHGFDVLTHQRVPPNDGGVSYGQAAVAAARMA